MAWYLSQQDCTSLPALQLHPSAQLHQLPQLPLSRLRYQPLARLRRLLIPGLVRQHQLVHLHLQVLLEFALQVLGLEITLASAISLAIMATAPHPVPAPRRVRPFHLHHPLAELGTPCQVKTAPTLVSARSLAHTATVLLPPARLQIQQQHRLVAPLAPFQAKFASGVLDLGIMSACVIFAANMDTVHLDRVPVRPLERRFPPHRSRVRMGIRWLARTAVTWVCVASLVIMGIAHLLLALLVEHQMMEKVL